MATTGDLPPENSIRFTIAASLAQSHLAIAHIRQPQIFSVPALVALLGPDSGMTQPGACRSEAVPKWDARADAPEVEQTLGSYRLPAAPLSSENSRGPEVLRPCLTAGLPLSAFGPKAAIHSCELDRHREGVLRCISPSRSQRRPLRRERSIDTHTMRTSVNLSHIADIIRWAQLGPAMNSSPISDVQPKSRRRLSDLCHMRDLRQPRRCQPSQFIGQLSQQVEPVGTVHDRHACEKYRLFDHRGAVTADGACAERRKKRGRIPCPSRNDR